MSNKDGSYVGYPELPPDAGSYGPRGFKLNERWLSTADPQLLMLAMRTWFLSRYCDPAEETPYDGREGGYQYIDGGPYLAIEVLQEQFSDLVDDQWIEATAEDLESGEGIVDWAPVNFGPDDEEYLERFALEDFGIGGARRNFGFRCDGLQSLRATARNIEEGALLRQMIFAQLIVLVEAYLQEIMDYWVLKSEHVLYKRAFVEHCLEFQKQKIALSELYHRTEQIDVLIRRYFAKLVWHRFEVVMALMRAVFEIETPPFDGLSKAVVKRHHIVHRAGRDEEGNNVAVSDEDLGALVNLATSFVETLDLRIQKVTGSPDDQFF